MTGWADAAQFVAMTQLPQAQAATTDAFLAEAGPRLADLCTACGACFKACPMAVHAGVAGSDAQTVTAGLRALARGETGPEATVKWVAACGKSGLCIQACPERDKGLDAMLLVRLARMAALNATKQMKPKGDALTFPRVKTFARLQLSDEELKRWL